MTTFDYLLVAYGIAAFIGGMYFSAHPSTSSSRVTVEGKRGSKNTNHNH